MTQFESNPYASPEDQMPVSEKSTHGLSIASLICSLICCIPALGLIGAALGVFALIAIGGNAGKYKGRGLAIAGIIIGLLITVLWIPGGWFAFKLGSLGAQAVRMGEQEVPAAMQDASDGTYQPLLDLLVDQSVTEADAVTFFETVESRYGGITSVSLSTQVQPAPGEAIMPFEYSVTFDDGTTRSVTARIQIANEAGQTFEEIFNTGLLRIEIDDDEQGDLTFP